MMKPGDLIQTDGREHDLWLMPWDNPRAAGVGDMNPDDRVVGTMTNTDIGLLLAVRDKECIVMCGCQFGWALLEWFRPVQ